MIVIIILAVLLCAGLGAYSGSRNTRLWPRRYLIPFIITCFAIHTHGPWAIFCMSMCGVFSIGYGRPDESDSGSTLGAFWYTVLKVDNPTLIDTYIRGSVGTLYIISLICIPIITGDWSSWLIGYFMAIGTYILFGAIIKNEWVIQTEEYDFLTEDMFIYGLLTTIAMGVIYV